MATNYHEMSENELRKRLNNSRLLEGAYAEAIVDDPEECAECLTGPLQKESDRVTHVMNELHSRGLSINL